MTENKPGSPGWEVGDKMPERDAPTLGVLDKVELRRVWKHEAHDFTPWLAENLAVLGPVSGIELECEDTEVTVGALRVDIVARIVGDDSPVVIENQLEEADLKHLGALLAYVAGLEATTVIWVARSFRDDHLAAIRWLNEHTGEHFAFFAVEISLVRIGASDPAPRFEVVERPNTWTRTMHRPGGLSERGEFRRRFRDFCRNRWKDVARPRPGYAGQVWWHPIPERHMQVALSLHEKKVGVYPYKWGEQPEPFLRRIQPILPALRQKFGELQNDYGFTSLDIDARDERNWPEAADWLGERRRVYEEVIRKAATDVDDPG